MAKSPEGKKKIKYFSFSRLRSQSPFSSLFRAVRKLKLGVTTMDYDGPGERPHHLLMGGGRRVAAWGDWTSDGTLPPNWEELVDATTGMRFHRKPKSYAFCDFVGSAMVTNPIKWRALLFFASAPVEASCVGCRKITSTYYLSFKSLI